MILKWIRGHIGTEGATEQPAAPVASAAKGQPQAKTIYPPNDPGLYIIDPEELIKGNADLIQRLRIHAATDPDKFEKRFLGPIRELGRHINSMPATASDLYAGEGGLFRACVELAFLSYQASDGRIFTAGATVEVRHKLEPRWRYVCFVAGLLYPIGKPIANATATNAAGQSWPKHQMGVSEWAAQLKHDRMYVSWGSSRAPGEDIGPAPGTAAILSKVIGAENLEWLESGSPELTAAAYSIVSATGAIDSNIAGKVVQTMWTKARDREHNRLPQNYGRLSVGTHLAPYLIGSLRALVESGKWKPNESPLLVDKRGMYLRWPEAAQDLVAMAVSNGAQGVPGTPAILAELLKDARLVEASPANDLGLTEIVDPAGEIVMGYRVSNPNAVLPDFDPADFAGERTQALDDVIAEDPILGAKAEKPAVVQTQTVIPEVAALNQEPVVSQATLPLEEVDDGDGAEPASGQAEIKAPAQKEQAPAVETQTTSAVTSGDQTEKLAEAQERKYSDLVPKQVKNDLRTPLIIEVTGKVIEAWNARDESNKVMRMTENGAAILYDHLKTLMRSPPDWVNKMAEAGLIYTQPSLPGVKVQKISIPEGGPAKQAVVISKLGCRTLGLK